MSSGVFGDDTESTVVNTVTCLGNETEVLKCSHSNSDTGICSEHNAAVICQGVLTLQKFGVCDRKFCFFICYGQFVQMLLLSHLIVVMVIYVWLEVRRSTREDFRCA